MLLRLSSRYFRARSIDPDTIWIGLCEGEKRATTWAKVFFSDYVENSVRRVMALGPKEYVDKRMVNSASTALAMWRKLVKEADLTVLEAKRRQEPRAGDKWRLRFHGHTARMPTSSTATFEVSRVSSIPWTTRHLVKLTFVNSVAMDRPCRRSPPYQGTHVREGRSDR
jgi:hypothetical protein